MEDDVDVEAFTTPLPDEYKSVGSSGFIGECTCYKTIKKLTMSGMQTDIKYGCTSKVAGCVYIMKPAIRGCIDNCRKANDIQWKCNTTTEGLTKLCSGVIAEATATKLLEALPRPTPYPVS